MRYSLLHLSSHLVADNIVQDFTGVSVLHYKCYVGQQVIHNELITITSLSAHHQVINNYHHLLS